MCRILGSVSAAVAVGSVLLMASAATAGTTAFSNFGPGSSFDDQFGASAGFTGDAAMGFVSSAGGNVTDIDIAIMGAFGVWADVNLHLDDGGQPGTILGSWTFTSLPAVNSDPDPIHIDVTDSIDLTAGNTYWVSVELSDNAPGFGSVLWGFNDIGDTGPVASGNVGGSWMVQTDTRSAFSVTVPAPGALSAIGMFCLGRRRRRS